MKEYEIRMWEAAKHRDVQAFLELVDSAAIMVCGGYRCSGAEYAQIIKDFDVAEYVITGFEEIIRTDNICQVHYVIYTTVSDEHNKDLEGAFHITSTWKKSGERWKLIFNMDSRV